MTWNDLPTGYRQMFELIRYGLQNRKCWLFVTMASPRFEGINRRCREHKITTSQFVFEDNLFHTFFTMIQKDVSADRLIDALGPKDTTGIEAGNDVFMVGAGVDQMTELMAAIRGEYPASEANVSRR